MRSSLLLGSMYFWSLFIELKRSYKYNGIIACTGISTFNGHISKPVALCEKLKKINCIFFRFWVWVGGSAIFHMHFFPFLTHMRPFLVIFWVLKVSHCVTFLSKYDLGTVLKWGLVSNGKKKNYMYIKNDHLHGKVCLLLLTVLN